MADSTVTGLTPEATSMADNDLLYAVVGGNSRKIQKTNALGANLTALGALDATLGLLVESAAGTFVRRDIAVGPGLSVTNPKGTAGNPTVALAPTLKVLAKTLTGVRTMSDADGNVAFTGVGFKPSILIMLSQQAGDINPTWGFADNAKTGNSMSGYASGANYAGAGGTLARMFISTGASFVDVNVVSYDTDGFTLSFTKNGSPTGSANMKFIAIGGIG